MCLLSKKWEETFKIVTFINVLLEFNYFMVSVKKNQKVSIQEIKNCITRF
jgi:hypothetical protein